VDYIATDCVYDAKHMTAYSSPWPRRLMTVPLFSLLFLVFAALIIPLSVLALLFDTLCWLLHRKSAVLRMLWLLGSYFAAEFVGILALSWVWFSAGFGPGRSQNLHDKTAAIQQKWAGFLFWAVRNIYNLSVEIEGQEQVSPGPILVFIRHSSMVDTVLPVVFISNQHQITLRYVLKRELLWDPCLDIAGLHRLRNYFVDRKNANREEEFVQIAALAQNMAPNEGTLIYPEGTRFSARKLASIQEKLRGTPDGEWAQQLHCVLPPKLGGINALLNAAPQCDLVFMAHYGLELASHWSSIWQGALLGKTISIKFWRISAAHIPKEQELRKQWMQQQWLSLDEWLLSKQ
jgi:1-acyl-sn-glycerol-3-phosphate acyltransferase